MADLHNTPTSRDLPEWKKTVAAYEHADRRRSLLQLMDTLVPYAGLWVLMFLSLQVSYGLTLGLGVIAGGLLIRLFILFHDCGHGSFFSSPRANTWWGYILGVLTFTPCDLWWHEHARHHATAGNLDKRGVGDIWTLTAQEYLRASRWTRLKYRLVRNPFCFLMIGAPVIFVIIHRIPGRHMGGKQRRSVHWTNLGILVTALGISLLIGFKAYLMIQLPILMVASSIGVWLFYVQHQFEGVYWRRSGAWDYAEQALKGCSYYQLPRWLQWVTGNIGFHHIHHLSPRIPNYFLEACHNAHPLFQQVKPLTLPASLRSLQLRVYDEQNRQLISFRDLERRQALGQINA